MNTEKVNFMMCDNQEGIYLHKCLWWRIMILSIGSIFVNLGQKIQYLAWDENEYLLKSLLSEKGVR